jgi:hypothetical protein
MTTATLFCAVSALPAGHAAAQNQQEREITLIGCVMRESDYRDTYGPGLSGPRGPGIGVRDEYMLVDAREIASRTSIPADAATPCPAAGTTFPTAYELTGDREKEIAEYVGRRVVLTGLQQEAAVRPVGTSGLLRPTGGFDPLGHDLHLFEVEAETFRDLTATLAESQPAAPAPETAAAPAAETRAPASAPPTAAAEPSPAAPEPAAVAPQPAPPAPAITEAAPVAQPDRIARQSLPRTSSPLPLVGLFGLLSLAGAAGLHALRRRS